MGHEKATHAALRAWARAESARLARKVVHGLQRCPASGIYGDHFAAKSLWDEFCYDVQHGPAPALEAAWDQTIAPFLDHAVRSLAPEAAVLLSIYAAWQSVGLDDLDLIGSIWIEGMMQVVEEELRRLAGERRLDHLLD